MSGTAGLPPREESRPERVNARDRQADYAPVQRQQILPVAVAIALVVLGFLPIVNWIPGGHSAPWYGDVLQTWLSGAAIVVGITVVLIVVTRGRALSAAANLAEYASRMFDARPRLASLMISTAAATVYATVAQLVFDARPLFIDEIVQLYQARLFAAGQLTDHVGFFPEFFGALNVVSLGDRQFGQFPPGGPAHLLPGVLIGAPWLVMPLIGGAAVYVFSLLVRRLEPEGPVALAAILLFAFSPFMIFMSASHMNHVPTLFWVLIAWHACLQMTSQRTPVLGWALLFGLAAGVAASIRPVDAVAMTAPVLVWAFVSLRIRKVVVMSLAATCVGAAIPIALILGFNHATTGSSFLFGYELLWGKSHSLGFHNSPWGAAHSPARGLELLSLYALRLQSYLFETPTPSLIPVIATLAFTRRIAPFEKAMLWATVLLATAYFAYWHDGFYLGPRFFFVLVPVFALLAARAPRALGERAKSLRVRHVTFVSLTTAMLLGIGLGIPERARYYAQSLSNSRHRLAAPVEALGVRSALIFVRESWGSQVMARLWGRGITRSDAEALYRAVDTCLLDSALVRLEYQDIKGQPARSLLWPLLRDSALVRPSTLSPDRSERVLTGQEYSPRCLDRIADDQRGVALYPLLLAEPRGTNLFVRDLGEHNRRLTRAYPDRVAYLLLPRTPDDSVYMLRPLPPRTLATP